MQTYDSLGSRLHRGNDGIWYSYAQWNSVEQRDKAFAEEASKVSETRLNFQQAVEEQFPEIELEVVSDYLILPEKF